MNIKRLKISAILAVLTAGLFSTQVVPALEYIDEQKDIKTSKLEYKASKLFLSMESTVTVDKKPVAAVLDDLVEPEKSDRSFVQPRGGSVFIVTTDTDNFGTRTRYTLWFDEAGAILQRLKVRSGDDNEIHLYRYASDGYLEYRKQFNNKKFSLNLQGIKNYQSLFHPYPATETLNGDVTESSAFLYLAGLLKLQKPGDTQSFTVVSRGKLINVKMVVKAKRKLAVDYKVFSGSNNQHIEGKRDVLRIAILPVDANGKPIKNFKMMGLQGKLTLYLDVQSRALVQISGEVKVLGNVDIKLRKAVTTN